MKRAAIGDRARDSGVVRKLPAQAERIQLASALKASDCNLLVSLKESILWEFSAYEQAGYE